MMKPQIKELPTEIFQLERKYADLLEEISKSSIGRVKKYN